MTDQLPDIKNMIARIKTVEYHYEAQLLDRIKAVQAINWLIATVERLEEEIKAADIRKEIKT